MKPFLSVCMIVKDEEKVLKRCLESLNKIADEIIIADTGSKDNTREIALQFTELLFDYKWENDFSKARNFAASKASGEWILVVDADEFVDRESFENFKTNLKLNPPDNNILAVQIVNFVGVNGKDTSLNYHERLYKNDGSIQYYRNIHELLMHNDSKEKRGFSEFQIFHTGYMDHVVKEKDKSKRNLTLLNNKPKKDPIDYFFIGNEYDQIGDLDRAIINYKKGFNLKDDIHRDWVIKLLLRLVNSLHKAKRNNEAIEIIDSCENIFPHLVDFKFYKGKIMFDKNNFDKSKEIFEEILIKKSQLKADSSGDFLEFLPHKYLGEIYETENQLHEAVQHYSKALSINDADDYLWMRLLNLLAKHSSLEELVDFLNRNLLNKPNITPQRVIRILLSVPNINVQKLTRSLLNEQELSSVEKDALYIKNLFLDKDFLQIISILNEKPTNELVSILGKGIFSLIDFIILAIGTNNLEYKKILFDINFDTELNNLLNVIFNNRKKRMNSKEEELFISILQQSEVLNWVEVINHLNSKLNYVSPNCIIKIKKMRKLIQ